jgi:hydroxymethylbilane synthase
LIQDRSLAEEGGNGLFTKEIEEALLDRRIDLAVHSAKDMPTILPKGLVLAACLEREDPRDVFISRKARSLAELPRGATLGTASLRRQAIAKRARPDLSVMPLRGNVETRLRKLEAGDVDATLLALAGLKRLGLVEHATDIMSADEFLPAVGQGAIGIETRENDARVSGITVRIDHSDTSTAIACERAFLAALDGSCKTPIAGHATVIGDAVQFRGLIARPDGTAAHDIAGAGNRKDAAMIGTEAGRELKHRAGPGFFD